MAYSWGAVEKGLDELLSDPNACMRRLDLLMVCTAAEQQTRSSTPAGTSVLECLRCFTKTMQLLANMLSVRKRARWAQQEYIKGMLHTLTAATAVLQHPSLHANPVASGKMARRLLGDTELLLLVAAAQREVAQLLTAQAQQRQQQQQPLDNDQARLQMLGHRLLLWWLEAHQLWLTNPDRDSLARATTAAAAEGYYAYHLQAVELAAAALQAAGPNCIPERFLTVAQVREHASSSSLTGLVSSGACVCKAAHQPRNQKGTSRPSWEKCYSLPRACTGRGCCIAHVATTAHYASVDAVCIAASGSAYRTPSPQHCA